MRDARIDPANWLKDQYARSRGPSDLLRFPMEGYDRMSPEEKERLRQTQVESGEVVRMLGHHEGFTLAMKFDRTLGWVPKQSLEATPSQKLFPPIPGPRKTPAEFLSSWKGTPYVWGGWSRDGIDCSGFTQRFFLEVHGLVIPKNSRDQRKAGQPKGEPAPSNDDLIFCHPKAKGPGVHHVALYRDHAVWHARLGQGVVRQTWEEFTSVFEVEEIVSVA